MWLFRLPYWSTYLAITYLWCAHFRTAKMGTSAFLQMCPSAETWATAFLLQICVKLYLYSANVETKLQVFPIATFLLKKKCNSNNSWISLLMQQVTKQSTPSSSFYFPSSSLSFPSVVTSGCWSCVKHFYYSFWETALKKTTSSYC